MSEIRLFILTEDHLKLLKRANIDWCDACTGAPCIDPKRPYGNSYVEGDVFEILDWKVEENMAANKLRKFEKRAFSIHCETQLALQVVLTCQTFKVGPYIKIDEYSFDSWESLSEEHLFHKDKEIRQLAKSHYIAKGNNSCEPKNSQIIICD